MDSHQSIQLLDFIKQEKLEKILRVFTRATGVASIMTDVDGHPITRPQNFTRFCLHYCRSTPQGRQRCYESDRYGGAESARTRKPCIYQCLNGGLIDFAAPVIVQGHHLATILGGQVLEQPIHQERAVERATDIGIRDVDGYLEELHKVPFMTREKLLTVVDLMSVITQTVSELALQKYLVQKSSKQYLNVLIDSVSDCIISTDANNVITMVNKAGAAMFGYEPQHLLGRSIIDLFADARSKQKLLAQFREPDQNRWRRELNAIAADGDTIPVQVSFSKIQKKDNHYGDYVGVIRDITAEKKMARMKEDLIGMVTHDMRNPILSIQKALELMVAGSIGEFSEGQRQVLELVFATSKQLYGMVSNLLDIYREENGSFLLRRTQFDIYQLLHDSLRHLDLFAKERSISFRHNVNGDGLMLTGDKDRLFRVCINLLENAVKYSPEGSRISLAVDILPCDGAERTAKRGSQAEEADRSPPPRLFFLRIDDQGPGIPRKYHGRIFDKFFTLQTKRSDRKEGVGLGLVFCKQVIEAHGGRIWVESPIARAANGKRHGSSFRFVLPVESFDFETNRN